MYSLWAAVTIAIFWRPVTALAHFAIENDDASHILLIPFISAWVLILERKRIFCRAFYDFPVAAFFFFPALCSFGWTLGFAKSWTLTDRLTGYTLALVLFWITGFALIFGRDALRAGRFSLLLLLLALPLPDYLLNHVVYLLQKGSAEITATLFDLTGVPYLREGFVFHLARVSIEVAHECSGIRSSMALLILALLVSHFFLRKFWKQSVFLLCGIVVMIVKNGIRIVTLTLLASYVDPAFLYGNLHREGGVVFFLLGLLMLLPILWLLQRGEMADTDGSAIPAARTIDKPESP
jgi:exosortase